MSLPPNQRELPKAKYPVLHVGKPPKFDPTTWSLKIHGEVENPLELTFEQFEALHQSIITADMHCVTRWTVKDQIWEGVDFYEIIKMVKPTSKAISVEFLAYDDVRYSTSIRLDDNQKLFIPERKPNGQIDETMGYIGNQILEPTGNIIELDQVILATKVNGETLTPDHGYPMRIAIPRLYGWKGTKWCREIIFKDHHDLGFWEKYGYSDIADPQVEDRTEDPEAQKTKARIYREQRVKDI